MNHTCQIVIPARLASTRLDQKLLQKVAGKSVLQHTYESAMRSQTATSVLVAVDHPTLAELCDSFGAPWIMTSQQCPSGTDRIAEVAQQLSDIDVFVNVQGDEPEIDPAAIDAVANALIHSPTADMSTAGTPIREARSLTDPSVVKIVMGDCLSAENHVAGDDQARGIPEPKTALGTEQGREGQRRAIYFSRAAVPYYRDQNDRDQNVAILLEKDPPIYWHHLGLYAYRRSFLRWFANQSPSLLEQTERLEQLRAIEAGKTVVVAPFDDATPGIDTQADLDAFRRRLERSPHESSGA